jgi:hypothetical protein
MRRFHCHDRFGASAPNAVLIEKFGFNPLRMSLKEPGSAREIGLNETRTGFSFGAVSRVPPFQMNEKDIK